MKTWEEINEKLKCMQGIMALHRIADKTASPADMSLIGHILNNDPDTVYTIKFNPNKKQVLIYCEYKDRKFYRALSFHLHDVFQGLHI